MTSKFVSVMEAIGRDIKIVYTEVMKYLPKAEALAAVIFPAQAAALSGVINATNLIQQAVATVEQKFAAMGAPTGTGPQKLAQVTAIVGPAVTQLLTAEGLQADAAYVTRLVNAVVAVLNVHQTAPASYPGG